MSTWPNRGCLRRPLRGAGREEDEQPKQSDRVGLTQANRPPRNPVRFNQLVQLDIEYESLRQAFDYVNRVCNAAIHGQEVTKEQADEALKLGAQIIDVLSLNPDAKS